VFEDGVLRKSPQPEREKVTGESKRLSNEELCDLYSSNIIQVLKSRRR
jgi:hypothetical protein